jgi:hypothetical protein
MTDTDCPRSSSAVWLIVAAIVLLPVVNRFVVGPADALSKGIVPCGDNSDCLLANR